MDLNDHFTKREIKKLNELPENIKKLRWVVPVSLIFLLLIISLSLDKAVQIGHCNGIHGLKNVTLFTYGDIEIGKTYQWYEVLINKAVWEATFLIILIFGIPYSYYGQPKFKLLSKCWNLLLKVEDSSEQHVESINLNNYFTEKEIKHFNGLPFRIKLIKRVCFVLLVIFTITDFLFFQKAIDIKNEYNAKESPSVLSSWRPVIIVGKTYPWNEVLISKNVNISSLFILPIIWSFLGIYYSREKYNLLLRCWRLLKEVEAESKMQI